MAFHRRCFTAVTIAIGWACALAAAAAPACPRHVQSVLLSRQYDDCLAHLHAPDASAFAFTAANAKELHASDACVHALTELLAVAPRACVATLAHNNMDVLIEAQQLQWLASHPTSSKTSSSSIYNPLQLAYHSSSGGGSTLYALRYNCYFDSAADPFNATAITTGDGFVVWCRQSTIFEYGGFWTIVGWIFVAVLVVLAAFVAWVYIDDYLTQRRASDSASETTALVT